jgi:hypothetical protein
MAQNKSGSADDQQDIPYHFHAGAQAFSAHFVRPVDVPIPAQAAVFLPNVGGHAHSRVENFMESRLASFKVGESHVTGSWEEPTVATTSATALLEKLSVLDFLTADKIVCRLSGRYEDGQKSPESHIMALGSYFQNLQLGGFEVKVILRHELLVESETFADLTKNLKGDTSAVIKSEVIFCTLVEKLEPDPHLLKVKGFKVVGRNRMIVPNFGKIALGEIVATPGSIHLTMLRFKLGSPDGGGGSGGQGGTNGQPTPTG